MFCTFALKLCAIPHAWFSAHFMMLSVVQKDYCTEKLHILVAHRQDKSNMNVVWMILVHMLSSFLMILQSEVNDQSL